MIRRLVESPKHDTPPFVRDEVFEVRLNDEMLSGTVAGIMSVMLICLLTVSQTANKHYLVIVLHIAFPIALGACGVYKFARFLALGRLPSTLLNVTARYALDIHVPTLCAYMVG